jgi:hypothetical protein
LRAVFLAAVFVDKLSVSGSKKAAELRFVLRTLHHYQPTTIIKHHVRKYHIRAHVSAKANLTFSHTSPISTAATATASTITHPPPYD